ncbi:MAG TPA: hypothetical protein VN181_05110 [Thermoanaerobaculia bacterium]|nr:hypothetical protein [Thermoanaerobaculia bacterium]
MQFDAVLKTFKEFFEREGIRYALAGGLAVVAWGHQRPTNDADFVVGGTDGPRVRAFAESLGYETTHVSNGFSNHRHPNRTFGDLDLMYVYGDTAEQVFAGSRPRDALGVELPVTRPEHLIAMKVVAMKNSPLRVLIDAPDIAYLLTLPGIDRARAREYFAKHGLLKIYDELTQDLG